MQKGLLSGGGVAPTQPARSFDTLPQACEPLLPQVWAIRGIQLVGLPAIEFYPATAVDTSLASCCSDVALPVRRLLADA